MASAVIYLIRVVVAATKYFAAILPLLAFAQLCSMQIAGAAPSTTKTDAKVAPAGAKMTASQGNAPLDRLEFLLRSGQVSQAKSLLAKTPATALNEDGRHMWLGACLAAEQSFEEAVVELDKVSDLSGAGCQVLKHSAAAYFQTAAYEKAIKLSTLQIARCDDFDTYRTLAGCYLATRQYAKAAETFSRAAQKRPARAPEAYVQAASAMLVANRPAEALAYCEKAPLADHGAAAITPLIVKASCLEKLNRWQEAVTVLNGAMTRVKSAKGVGPEMAETMIRGCLGDRAKCYDQLGKPLAAAADRAQLKRMSEAIEDDLVGRGR